jgi:hypothetical protein
VPSPVVQIPGHLPKDPNKYWYPYNTAKGYLPFYYTGPKVATYDCDGSDSGSSGSSGDPGSSGSSGSSGDSGSSGSDSGSSGSSGDSGSKCVGVWEQCAGYDRQGADCCNGLTCKYVNEWYSYCVESDDKECLGLWQQCGGKSWSGPSECCTGSCVYKNPWYSQCLP